MKSAFQMLPHRELSREMVARAEGLFQEFDGLIVNDLNKGIYTKFVQAYEAFMRCMKEKFVSEDTIKVSYANLRDAMYAVLIHYTDVSMTSRNFALAVLKLYYVKAEYRDLLSRGCKAEDFDDMSEVSTRLESVVSKVDNCILPSLDEISEISADIHRLRIKEA